MFFLSARVNLIVSVSDINLADSIEAPMKDCTHPKIKSYKSITSLIYVAQGPTIVWMIWWGEENADPKCAVRVENSAEVVKQSGRLSMKVTRWFFQCGHIG